jgi:hypothetical protein
MREAVVHTTKVAKTTTIASARVAKFLADTLNCPLLDGDTYGHKPNAFDRVFYVNSMGAFATPDFRVWMRDMAAAAKQVIYVQQDYTIHPISQTQKSFRARGWSHDFPFTRGPIIWTTVPEFICKQGDHYVNWNALTYDPVEFVGDRQAGIVYWGSFRQDRVESFKRYFWTDRYPIHLLCSTPVFNKFHDFCETGTQETGHGIFLVNGKPWKQIPDLAAYRATVYIEDDKQHGEFHSLANRFYEALSAGQAIFIDSLALSTFEKAGLAVRPQWVVENAQDVERLLPYAEDIAQQQRGLWSKAFRHALIGQIATAYNNLPGID